jgi:hypothetical protein
MVSAALCFGAQDGTALLLVGILVVLAAGVSVREGGKVPPLAWALWALASFCVVQAIPLPLAWLQKLNPASFEVWSRSLRAFGEPAPSLGSLSIDPGASIVEGWKWCVYGYLAVACASVKNRFGSSVLSGIVFASGVLVAVVTLIHGALDAPAIYGFYTPTFGVERWSKGPLLNSNNLAGYANLALFCGIASALSGGTRPPRWLLLGGCACLLLVSFLSGSRGGLGALLFGAVLLSLLLSQAARPALRSWLGRAALVGLAAIVAGVVVADERVYQLVFTTEAARKIAVWKYSRELIADYWAFGTGRGAFETAFASYYRPLPDDYASIFSHAENFPIQFLSEWGVGVGGAALAAGSVALATLAWRRRRHPVALALATGLAALLAQNLADLGLEIPAIGLAAVAAASALPRSTQAAVQRPLARSVAFGVPALALLLLAARPAYQGVQADRAAVVRRFEHAKASLKSEAPALRRELRLATLRHPGEWYFAYVSALLAYRLRDVSPMPALERALERSPYHGGTHLLLGHALARAGARSQALLHLRLAATYDRTLTTVASERAIRWSKNGEELVAALPRDASILGATCRRLPAGERAIACWGAQAKLATDQRAAEVSLAGAHLDALEAGLAPCAPPTACEAAVEAAVARLKKSDAIGSDFRLLSARLRAVRGDVRGAADELLKGCPLTVGALRCHEYSIQLAGRLRDNDLLVQAVNHWVPLACASADCAEAHARAGQLLRAAGASGLALGHLIEAARAAPTAARWLDAAETAIEGRNFVGARLALERARQFGLHRDDDRRRYAEIEARLATALTAR